MLIDGIILNKTNCSIAIIINNNKKEETICFLFFVIINDCKVVVFTNYTIKLDNIVI